MRKQRIPSFTVEMYNHLPDQMVDILNRLVTEVNDLNAYNLELTNAIIDLRKQIKGLEPTPVPPTPTGEWRQLLAFSISHMGTERNMCLKNTREGFGIGTATFQTARADMESQIANGTLHAGTPPADIAVPIYYSNFSYVAAGHVAVWDHGVVYSDGQYYPSIEAVASNYTGWGELCDGTRVVEKVPEG